MQIEPLQAEANVVNQMYELMERYSVPAPPEDFVVFQVRTPLAISRSQVQILLRTTLHNNLRQVVHTYVPLSPNSITWYRPKGGDALRLGR